MANQTVKTTKLPLPDQSPLKHREHQANQAARVNRVNRATQRRMEVAPLWAYLRAHGIAPLWAARRASLRATGVMMTKLVLSRVKLGQAPLPDWFIPAMCHEIGQPVEVVMGEEWVQEHQEQLARFTRCPDRSMLPATLGVSTNVSAAGSPGSASGGVALPDQRAS